MTSQDLGTRSSYWLDKKAGTVGGFASQLQRERMTRRGVSNQQTNRRKKCVKTVHSLLSFQNANSEWRERERHARSSFGWGGETSKASERELPFPPPPPSNHLGLPVCTGLQFPRTFSRSTIEEKYAKVMALNSLWKKIVMAIVLFHYYKRDAHFL